MDRSKTVGSTAQHPDAIQSNWLDRLFPELGREKFLEQFWPRNSAVGAGKLERLLLVEHLRQFSDAGAAMQFVGKCTAEGVRIRGWFQDKAGNHKMVTLRGDQARDLYESGVVTVVVDRFELLVPELGVLLGQLTRELGTPIVYQCNLYVSPTGVGSVRHFDQQEVFFLQLAGKKRWLIERNEEISYPTGYYFGAQHVHPEVKALRADFGTQRKRASDHLLEPGSVLFLPRGFWHESETIEDSVALTLSMASISWLDLYSTHIRKKLLQIEAWREPAVGLRSAGEQHRFAATKFKSLLDDLSDRLRDMEVADFDSLMEIDRIGGLQRGLFGAAAGLELCVDDAGEVSVIARDSPRVRVSSGSIAIARSIVQMGRAFSALDVKLCNPGTDMHAIFAVIEQFLGAKLIVKV